LTLALALPSLGASGLGLAACRAPASDPEAAALAGQLRQLYGPATAPWERWRRRQTVRLPDGREVAREQAFRDDKGFPGACRVLLASRSGDEASLGAWLLGTVPASRAAEVEPVLVEALRSADSRAAFEAALSLERVGGRTAVPALEGAVLSGATPEIRTAAAVAIEEIERRRPGRADEVRNEVPADAPRVSAIVAAAAPSGAPALAPSFHRGVSWWWSEAGSDGGASSFRRLRALGVTWVSIHTWDPLQRGLHDPVFAEARHPFVLRDLDAIVKNAHQAGLAVMLKPHLEMRGYEPTPEERRILRGTDEGARRKLIAELESRGDGETGDHNRIEMQTDADWRRWFRSYETYLLPYAEAARSTGADAFCVGRELDTSVIRRESDWRRIIARVREVFPGPLAYSANFDTWPAVGFWDALDFIGVSAYFPLSDRPDPSLEDLAAGWGRALGPLEEASRRYGRPVLFTEVGYPSVPEAARAPWREARLPADVWLQARCYDAALRALAQRPWIAGAFFWLWERSAEPAFRDPSHTLPGKPAAYVMARWYRPGAELRRPDPRDTPAPPQAVPAPTPRPGGSPVPGAPR
jgi:hypothetical protein